MALIKCTECGHMISDKAKKCPKCGCPAGKGVSFSEDNNSIKKTTTQSQSNGRKWSLSNILWLVIPLIIFFLPFVVIPIMAYIKSHSSYEDSQPSDSYVTEELQEESYGPGTYEIVDEANQKWHLIIEIEREGSEADYSLIERNVCKLINLSNGKEYKGDWREKDIIEDFFMIRLDSEDFRHDCPIVFQKIPSGVLYFNNKFYLIDGYIYIKSDERVDKDGNRFSFEEALEHRDPRIRLPIKRIE